MEKEKAIAVLNIVNADEMTPELRRDVVAWLNHQAVSLLEEGAEYAPHFTARYIISEK